MTGVKLFRSSIVDRFLLTLDEWGGGGFQLCKGISLVKCLFGYIHKKFYFSIKIYVSYLLSYVVTLNNREVGFMRNLPQIVGGGLVVKIDNFISKLGQIKYFSYYIYFI